MGNLVNTIYGMDNGKEIVSSLISIINIITTISLAIVNIYIASKQKKNNNRKEALLSYYYPIKLLLTKLNDEIYMLVTNDIDVIDYNKNIQKREDVIKLYKNYIDKIDALRPQSIIYDIDCELIKFHSRLRLLITTLGQESYDISQVKEKYSCKNIKEIIDLIDSYLKKVQ